MSEKILNFIKYNNAFTIIFVVCFLSFGITFAASPAVRDNVYSSEETLVSVDNGLILSTNLDSFNFNLRINSVTEDEKNYYAVYAYQTLSIEDGFWQTKQVEKTLTISREALDGKDLGLYVAKELGENMNYELSYLKKVQKVEREKGESQKVIAVDYSGLIGKMLDPKELVIEGYEPVIPEVVEVEKIDQVELAPEEIVVSTPKIIQKETPTPVPISTPIETPTPVSPVSSSTEPVSESTSTPGDLESAPKSDTSSPVPEITPNPAPEEMVDEELVKEVVDKLLQEPTPTLETTTPTPEVSPESPTP